MEICTPVNWHFSSAKFHHSALMILICLHIVKCIFEYASAVGQKDQQRPPKVADYYNWNRTPTKAKKEGLRKWKELEDWKIKNGGRKATGIEVKYFKETRGWISLTRYRSKKWDKEKEKWKFEMLKNTGFPLPEKEDPNKWQRMPASNIGYFRLVGVFATWFFNEVETSCETLNEADRLTK